MEQAPCYIKKGEPSWNRRFQCWKLSSFFRFSSNLLCGIFSTSSSPDVWCIKSESLTKEYLLVHDVFHISLLPLQTCVHIKQPLRFFSWEASETWEQTFQFHDNDLKVFKWRFLPHLENEQNIALAILIKKPGKEPYFEMRFCVISTPFYISTFRALLNMMFFCEPKTPGTCKLLRLCITEKCQDRLHGFPQTFAAAPTAVVKPWYHQPSVGTWLTHRGRMLQVWIDLWVCIIFSMDVMFIQAFPLRGGGLAWKTRCDFWHSAACLILEELGDGKVVDHPAATNWHLPQLKGFKTVCWPERGMLRSMCFPFEKATI